MTVILQERNETRNEKTFTVIFFEVTRDLLAASESQILGDRQ